MKIDRYIKLKIKLNIYIKLKIKGNKILLSLILRQRKIFWLVGWLVGYLFMACQPL